MKKGVKIIAALMSLATCFTVATGCGGRANVDQTTDNTKTQLYVKYYNGGFGEEWLNKLVAEFEAAYANESFEAGKTGVQIMKEFTRGQLTGPSSMKGNRNNVYLMEDVDYYTYASEGVLMDISDVVDDYAITGLNQKETDRKISAKIPGIYDEFLKIDGKYYALPLFETSINLNYDIDLFEQKCLYFADGKTAEGFTEDDYKDEGKIGELFVADKTDERSAGPDGKKGTDDDGLPATYADFRALTIYMKIVSVTPFVWNGYETGYLTGLINDMWANNEGAEQMKLNFTFDGTAKTLVDTIGSDGSVTLKGDTVITADNKQLLQRQKGKLDALRFAELLLDDGTGRSNSRNYYSKSFESSFLHTNAQNYFIDPEANGIGDNPIGFLVDGGWWYKEAKVTDRNIGILPLPKTDASKIGTPNTKVCDHVSYIFIGNETPAAVVPLAKAFVSFINSDYALQTYTQYTSTMRAMDYEMPEATLATMNAYGRSVYANKKTSDTTVLPWVPVSAAARSNASYLAYRTYGFSVNSADYTPLVYLNDHKDVTPEQYFEQIWTFRNK